MGADTFKSLFLSVERQVVGELVYQNESQKCRRGDAPVSVKEDVTFIRLFGIETSWSPETDSDTPQFAPSTFGAPYLESVQDASSRL